MDNKLLFVDIETSGLDKYTDRLLEICAVVVDEHFNPGAVFRKIIKIDSIPDCDPVVRAMHTANNLFEDCLHIGEDIGSVGHQFHKFMYDNDLTSKVIIAGAGPHFDREWLLHVFPWIKDSLHYRLYDINTLLMTYNLDIATISPRNLHRAYVDNMNAIQVAREYYTTLKDLFSFDFTSDLNGTEISKIEEGA